MPKDQEVKLYHDIFWRNVHLGCAVWEEDMHVEWPGFIYEDTEGSKYSQDLEKILFNQGS